MNDENWCLKCEQDFPKTPARQITHWGNYYPTNSASEFCGQECHDAYWEARTAQVEEERLRVLSGGCEYGEEGKD